MSIESDIVNAILTHVAAEVPGVTTRNALVEGFIDRTRAPQSDFPWWQGFGVTAEATSTDFGQEVVVYSVDFFALRSPNPDAGDQMATDLDAVIAAVEDDYSLGGLVIRTFASEWAVDVVTGSERDVLGAVTFACQVNG